VEVDRGGSVIDPKVVEALVAARSRTAESPIGRLTPREQEVLDAMAQGKNNAGIAAALGLTERAVEKHINSIFSKLGLSEEPDVHRRVKAVLLFLSERGG
jgi:DNA-binding NarL/FixJ family response regulator